MSDIVIKAENLGKKYIIGHQAENGRYVALRDVLMHNAKTLWNKTRDLLKGKAVIQGDTMEEVWALKDVNFEIKRGEAVGIIGRNGAGKSTLLKVLSRITEPSTGRVTIRGRVASLLEVGTGFHPELTGRENIYLNGTILGMTRVEIKKKFDEIVAFAEIEKFLDTPVKRYSSGMYMRLAFAVAAHLEPEILVVDEVLAVGDIAFQKKCLGKMGEVSKEGRTVLFVSHNMGAIQQLCRRGLHMQSGKLFEEGQPSIIIQKYLSSAIEPNNAAIELLRYPRKNTKTISIIQKLILYSSNEIPTSFIYPNATIFVDIFLRPERPIKEPRIALSIEDNYGHRIMSFASFFQQNDISDIYKYCRVRCTIPQLKLGTGHYLMSVSVATKYDGLLDNVEGALRFEIGWNDYYGNGEPYYPIYGPVLTKSEWKQLD